LSSIEGNDSTSRSPPLSSNHGRDEDFFFIYDRSCGVNVATADGSVDFLRTENVSTDSLRKMLQAGGYTEEVRAYSNNGNSAGRRLNWPNIAALAVWLLSVCTLLTAAVRSRKRCRP
jgi:hypothetical protein